MLNFLTQNMLWRARLPPSLSLQKDCAEMIRRAVDEFAHSGQMIPTVLEIPSKDTPYDPRKDGVMQRVAFLMPSAMASLGVEI